MKRKVLIITIFLLIVVFIIYYFNNNLDKAIDKKNDMKEAKDLIKKSESNQNFSQNDPKNILKEEYPKHDGYIIEDKDTNFANSFTEKKFKEIKVGMNKTDVLNKIGNSLGDVWDYSNKNLMIMIGFNEKEIVHQITGFEIPKSALTSDDSKTIKKYKKVRKNMTKNEILEIMGSPIFEFWNYTLAPSGKSHKVRIVVFQNDKVVKKEKYFSRS
jgi:outer membrane protein assembly factor BamE (lipoprotein component of BamABCDE complex)